MWPDTEILDNTDKLQAISGFKALKISPSPITIESLTILLDTVVGMIGSPLKYKLFK